MQYYTFTTWQQVADWIRDNGLVCWEFCAQKTEERSSQYVCRSDWYAGEMANKLEQTRKALESQPGRYLYGSGWVNENHKGGDASCEVMISAGAIQGIGGYPMLAMQQMQMQQPQQIGQAQIDDMRRTIREEIQAEMDRKQFAIDRAALDKEKREFEATKTGAIGLMVGYLKPYLPLIQERLHLPKVAGVEDEQPYTPIQPVQPTPATDPAPNPTPADPEDPEEQSPFADAEADTIFELMKRFKAVEPDYLKLLAAVVEMAESGDATYTMARKMLLQ